MRHDFTAAAERALAEAAAWSTGEFCDALEVPALLLGLLAESECRAAMILARHGIDTTAVRGRWPGLVRLPNRFPAWDAATRAQSPPLEAGVPVQHIAHEICDSLAVVARRLRNCGLSAELGTEHMLLGLTVSDHEVSVWLRQHGVDPEAIEAEIRRVHGHETPSPVPLPHLPLGEGWGEGGPQEITGGASEAIGTAPHPNPLPEGEGTCRNGFRDSLSGAGTRPDAAAVPIPQERLRALRVIDAAANRAQEGLRVVEDYVRFVLDDRFLTALLKGLRHELTGLLGRFSAGERFAARDTWADVGTQITTSAERRREDTASVLAANFTRLKESLRSLEEFAKILDPAVSAALEQLRYQTYTLQRAVETTRIGIERLQHARLYVLIDGRSTPEEFSQLAQSLVSGGVHVIQLRDKQLDDRTLVERARTLREIASDGRVIFIMNDRPDLAVLSRADGVHVGQGELSVKDARTIVGPEAIIGVSTHNIEQARRAVLEGANYIGVGPTFPSETKQFDRFPGVELLGAVAVEIRLPAFAIGGIRLDNLPQVLETGLRRVAIGAAITTAKPPDAAARAFLAAIG